MFKGPGSALAMCNDLLPGGRDIRTTRRIPAIIGFTVGCRRACS